MLRSLVLIVVCPIFASGAVSILEKMSTQSITPSSLQEANDLKEPTPFYDALAKALKKRKTKLEMICPQTDPVARRILEEYGAIYVADQKVTPPPVCIFTNEEQVTRFQEAAGVASELIGFDEIELQPEALKKLKKAREEAQKEGLDITPRDGAEAARRNYEDSVRLWSSRFEPALDYWLSQGRLTAEQVARLRSLPLSQQVAEVLELEKNGIYFSKDLSKSILYSIAAPGTSQHIAMLAFDVNEFENPRVREIMAKHGWFQTVLSDLPHFTFLGLKEKDLPKHGLRNLEINGQTFWIPNVPGVHPGLDK
jgi:D-alanyl-D-alanine carboxypeptidase